MNYVNELERLTRENDILRGLVPALGQPCVHCGLTDIARCPFGFPGCAQADDIMVAQDETMKRLLEENRKLKGSHGKARHRPNDSYGPKRP